MTATNEMPGVIWGKLYTYDNAQYLMCKTTEQEEVGYEHQYHHTAALIEAIEGMKAIPKPNCSCEACIEGRVRDTALQDVIDILKGESK